MPPFLSRESNGLRGLRAIVPVSDEVVLGDRTAKQFHGGELFSLWQLSQSRGLWRIGHISALWKVGSLLHPPAERHAAMAEPFVELRHRVGTILRMQQRVGERMRLCEVPVLMQ